MDLVQISFCRLMTINMLHIIETIVNVIFGMTYFYWTEHFYSNNIISFDDTLHSWHNQCIVVAISAISKKCVWTLLKHPKHTFESFSHSIIRLLVAERSLAIRQFILLLHIQLALGCRKRNIKIFKFHIFMEEFNKLNITL